MYPGEGNSGRNAQASSKSHWIIQQQLWISVLKILKNQQLLGPQGAKLRGIERDRGRQPRQGLTLVVASSIRWSDRTVVWDERDLFTRKASLSAEKRNYGCVEGKDARTPEEDLTLRVRFQLRMWVIILVQVYFRSRVSFVFSPAWSTPKETKSGSWAWSSSSEGICFVPPGKHFTKGFLDCC